MKPPRAAFVLAVWFTVATTLAQSQSLQQAATLESQGRFKEASAVLAAAHARKGVSAAERRQLEFEQDRLERIRKDFPLTEEALYKALKKSLKGLDHDEFERWVAEGRFDSREIDGEVRFMVSSVSNLYFRYPELETRRRQTRDRAKYDQAVYDSCRALKAAVAANPSPYVLPKQFELTMTVTADKDVAPAGATMRAWLPIPRAYPFQTDFELLSADAPGRVASADSPIRSICLEKNVRRKKPTEFSIRYRYTAHGVCFQIDPEAATVADPMPPELETFTREAPHIVFTPEIRALAARIAGNETNRVRQAKLFYDWVTENIQYSYSIEYSTIRNISEYCRSRGYGDCGQEALLFMTLCRLNGIPARWQSGWYLHPQLKTIHDWCEIHVMPYGWVPVDPYMGIWAMRYARSLSPAQQREVRDFYFGGLDQWRMAANSDHCQNLTPPKRALRSDTVDFQRGELEWGTNNVYFNRFNYDLKVKEMKAE